MVCSLCGADECEAFGHTIQDWEIDGESMSAWCTVCYQPVSEAFDPQTVGEYRLIGKWDAEEYFNASILVPLISLDEGRDTLIFFAD